MFPNILDRLRAAATRSSGITLVGWGQPSVRCTYAELHQRANVAAAALWDHDVCAGDRVILVAPTSVRLVAAFLGCIQAGVIPSVCSLPQAFSGKDAFRRHVDRVCSALRTNTAVLDVSVVGAFDDRQDRRVIPIDELERSVSQVPRLAPARDRVAFIQGTSGTTGGTRAVTISHGALSANLSRIASGADIRTDSTVVSWLPLSHDMGLVGGLLTPLFVGCELVLSRPSSFLRRPQVWLDWITQFAGTHSPAPTFAYQHVLDRATIQSRLDLGSWSVAWVGAEQIHAALLSRFAERFATAGFRRRAFLPCYGLAEATLAVTFADPVAEPRILHVQRDSIAEGMRVVPGEADSALGVVSCGHLLPGLRLSIAGRDGTMLEEERVGEVVLSGDSLFSGYFDANVDCANAPPVPLLRTGDLGFVHDGELYISGRSKDLMIIRGRNYHPSEVEVSASQVDGIRAGRVAACSLSSDILATEQPVILVEAEDLSGELLVTEVRRRVLQDTGVVLSDVVVVPSGTIPYTTSGKLRRSELPALYQEFRSRTVPVQ